MSEREKYQRYLCTPEWFARRNAVMERSNGRCERCGKKAAHVHHLTYIRKYNELLTDLQAVCEQCHESIHYPKAIRPRENNESITALEREFFELVLFGNQYIAEIAFERASNSWFESIDGIYLYGQLKKQNEVGERAKSLIGNIESEYRRKSAFLLSSDHYKLSMQKQLDLLTSRLKLHRKDMSPPPGVEIPF